MKLTIAQTIYFRVNHTEPAVCSGLRKVSRSVETAQVKVNVKQPKLLGHKCKEKRKSQTTKLTIFKYVIIWYKRGVIQ